MTSSQLRKQPQSGANHQEAGGQDDHWPWLITCVASHLTKSLPSQRGAPTNMVESTAR